MIRTGLIIGMADSTDRAHAVAVVDYLTERFPGVTIAVVAGAVDSLCFPFDDGTPPPDGWAPPHDAPAP